jgi:4-hydroxy-4-methyl-2-oxoglutarate aldolase
MKTVVVRNIKRANAADVKRLGALGTSTVHEAYGRSGLMKPYMRPAWAGGEAAGTAVTVLAHPGDNWMIHVAVEQCRAGDILVVGCSADNTDGMFGDLLATSLMARGVVGLVIDAGCRDVKSLREMGFPVWSKAISAKGPVKAALGAVNIPVVCAGVNVHPGDAVVADDDGVVVVRKKETSEVAAKGEKRHADEEGKRKQLAAGALGLDMYNMREPLAKAGLVYIDEPEAD